MSSYGKHPHGLGRHPFGDVRRAPRRARRRRTPRACSRSSSSRARGSRSASTTRPGELEVVLHSSVAQLDAAQPWLPARAPPHRARRAPLRRRLGGPARAARAVPAAARAPGVERRGLAGDADARAVGAARAPLRRRRPPEAAAAAHARPRSPAGRAGRGWSRAPRSGSRARRATSRPAIARRLREGPPPTFPPSRADALLLGGTIFDLLAREEGDRACVTLARGPHPDGPIRALEIAFPRSLRHTESAWRSHLAPSSAKAELARTRRSRTRRETR